MQQHRPGQFDLGLSGAVVYVLGMTTTKHTNCTHPATKAARAACRKGTHLIPAAEVAARLGVEVHRDDAVIDYSAMKYDFEADTCGRCLGSGRYPSAAWNGVCLGCNGKGKSLTRAGRAAKKAHDEWIAAHLMIPARDLQPGMKFRPSPVDGWKTVVAVDAEPHHAGTSTVGSGDNAVTTEIWHIDITTKNMTFSMSPDSTVQRNATPAERNALIAAIANRKGTILTPR